MGELYADSMLVRVVGEMTGGHGRPAVAFCAGLLVDRDTGRVVFAAPLLGFLVGQELAKLRRTFARLGWRATIVH